MVAEERRARTVVDGHAEPRVARSDPLAHASAVPPLRARTGGPRSSRQRSRRPQPASPPRRLPQPAASRRGGPLAAANPAATQRQRAVEQRREPQLAERRRKRVRVEAAELHRLQVDVDRHVALDGRDDAARQRGVAVLSEVLADLALDLLGMREDLVERAVLLQQLGSGLLADPGHAGDVVARVALEPEVVGHLCRRDAVALEHLGRTVDDDVGDALLGGHDADVIGHELERVAVAGDEQHADPGFAPPPRQRAEDVVALPPFELDDGHVERGEQLLDHRETEP